MMPRTKLKKKKGPSRYDRIRYNTYVKKETMEGRSPADFDSWMKKHGSK